MRRNLYLLFLTAFILPAPHLAEAQPVSKVPRIGLLFPGSLSYGAPNVEAFRLSLRELNYIEGENIRIEYRVGEGKSERYSQLASELVNPKVDIIVTASTPAIQAVQNATKTIPVVMAAAADPIGTGLVTSLAPPGANITGLSMRSPELSGNG